MVSRKMLRWTLVGGVLLMMLFPIMSAFPQAKAEVTNWKMHGAYASHFYFNQAWRAFSEEVAKKTNGQLIITVYPSSGLGFKPDGVIPALRDEIVPIAEISSGYAAGVVREFDQLNVFYINKDMEDHDKQVAAVRKDYEKMVLDKFNVKILAFVGGTPTHLFTKKKINSMDDFKGLKIRTMGPAMSNQAKLIGIVPTAVIPSELSVALERGIIDGLYTTIEGLYTMKLYEYVTTINLVNLNFGTFMVGVNKKAFDRLSPEVQTVLLSASSWLEKEGWPRIRNRELAMSHDALKGLGLTSHTPPSTVMAELKKVGKQAAEENAARFGEAGKDRLDRMLRAVGQ